MSFYLDLSCKSELYQVIDFMTNVFIIYRSTRHVQKVTSQVFVLDSEKRNQFPTSDIVFTCEEFTYLI